MNEGVYGVFGMGTTLHGQADISRDTNFYNHGSYSLPFEPVFINYDIVHHGLLSRFEHVFVVAGYKSPGIRRTKVYEY